MSRVRGFIDRLELVLPPRQDVISFHVEEAPLSVEEKVSEAETDNSEPASVDTVFEIPAPLPFKSVWPDKSVDETNKFLFLYNCTPTPKPGQKHRLEVDSDAETASESELEEDGNTGSPTRTNSQAGNKRLRL